MNVKDVFDGQSGTQEVSASGVNNTFGLSGTSGGLRSEMKECVSTVRGKNKLRLHMRLRRG